MIGSCIAATAMKCRKPRPTIGAELRPTGRKCVREPDRRPAPRAHGGLSNLQLCSPGRELRGRDQRARLHRPAPLTPEHHRTDRLPRRATPTHPVAIGPRSRRPETADAPPARPLAAPQKIRRQRNAIYRNRNYPAIRLFLYFNSVQQAVKENFCLAPPIL